MFGENAPGSPSVLSGLGTPDSAAAQAASLSGFASAALHLVQTVLSTCSGSSFKHVLRRWVSTTVLFLPAGG